MVDIRTRATALARWGPECGDALLYGVSALFAGATASFLGIALYRVWGQMAVGPYLVAAGISMWLFLRRRRREPQPETRRRVGARLWVLLFVLLGATLAPLALEVSLRSDGDASLHVQPEVLVIEQAGSLMAQGKDPYHAFVEHGHVVSAVPGEPSYESFFPYLPLMAVFGLRPAPTTRSS